jgi:ribosomal protein L3
MSGHLGNVRRTSQNLEIVRVDVERNLLLVKGSVPGHKEGRVFVNPAVKHPEAQAWVPVIPEVSEPADANDAEEIQAS